MSEFSGKQGCDKVRELLSAHVDDKLAPSEKGPVEEHLASCKPCNEELASLRATRDMLRCLPSIRPSRSFALVEKAAPRPVAFGFLRLATAVAALLLLLVGMGDWWHFYPRVTPPLAPTVVTTPEATPAPTVIPTAQPEPTQSPTRVSKPKTGMDSEIIEVPGPAGPPPGKDSVPGSEGKDGAAGQADATPAVKPSEPAVTAPAALSGPAEQGAAVPAPDGEYVWPVHQVEIGLLFAVVVLLVLALVSRRKARVKIQD